MKRYAMFFAAAAALAGCQDLYPVSSLDNSVDDKINTIIDEYQKVLVGDYNRDGKDVYDDGTPEDAGWIAMINTSEGYYQYWMDFHPEGGVEMMTDNTRYPQYLKSRKSSTYTFRALQRPTLSFDTYSYIHLMNNPDNEISGGSGNKGLVTDYEFEVDRYDAENEVFYMKGRFNKVDATFRRATPADTVGVNKGNLMSRVRDTYQNAGWANKYIVGSNNGTDIVVKLSDQRNAYMFRYRGGGEGNDGMGYYNVDANDQSKDLRFPEPFEAGGLTLTGLKSGSRIEKVDGKDTTVDYFEAFKTAEGQQIPVKIYSSLAEMTTQIDPAALMGVWNNAEGKMFDEATGTGIAPTGNGVTATALNWLQNFIGYEGWNIILSCDVEYYFRYDDDSNVNTQLYFHVDIQPAGFGFTTSGDSGEQIQSKQYYEKGQYRFAVREFKWPIFTLSSVVEYVNPVAKQYCEKKKVGSELESYDPPTSRLINGIVGKTFKLQWSDLPNDRGVVVDFWPQGQVQVQQDGKWVKVDPTRENAVVPSAILTKRGN